MMRTVTAMRIKTWNIEEKTGYTPRITFYEDFSIADYFDCPAVRDTYCRVFNTELVMILNLNIWEHHRSNYMIAGMYANLWREAD